MRDFHGAVLVPPSEAHAHPPAKRARTYRKRAKRDPNAPKRHCSAFLFFANDARARLRARYPEKHNVDISRMLGALWKNLDDATRRPYLDRERAERDDYERRLAEYVRATGGRPPSPAAAAPSDDDDDGADADAPWDCKACRGQHRAHTCGRAAGPP